MLEAIASDSTQEQVGENILSRGYGDTSIPDLMVDYRPGENHPFAWICYNRASLTRRVLQHALASV